MERVPRTTEDGAVKLSLWQIASLYILGDWVDQHVAESLVDRLTELLLLRSLVAGVIGVIVAVRTGFPFAGLLVAGVWMIVTNMILCHVADRNPGGVGGWGYDANDGRYIRV